MTAILHLLGGNGVGKTTLMNTMKNTYKDVHGFSTGQILRKRYSPEYFQGQAAPESTEAEALEIYKEQIRDATFLNPETKLIISDGQPRKASQVNIVTGIFPMHQRDFLLMHLPHEMRKHRLSVRDQHDDAALDLAMERLNGDYRNTYECMIELARLRFHLDIVDLSIMSLGTLMYNLEKQYGLELKD